MASGTNRMVMSDKIMKNSSEVVLANALINANDEALKINRSVSKK